MKVLGLDIGSVWIGSALSDGAGITCRPYQTVQLDALPSFLETVLRTEPVRTIVVGHPITVGKGGASAQTKEIEDIFKRLSEQFSQVTWILWDERYSTQRAQAIMHGKKKKLTTPKSIPLLLHSFYKAILTVKHFTGNHKLQLVLQFLRRLCYNINKKRNTGLLG
jgi:Predicted endonuclease involved in recombination (possible Holliday junction resolvase in Mycoplasmas and B. subtilis)